MCEHYRIIIVALIDMAVVSYKSTSRHAMSET